MTRLPVSIQTAPWILATVANNADDVKAALARARDHYPSDPAQERQIRERIDDLVRQGRIAENDPLHNHLDYRLKLFGEPLACDEHTRYLRLRDWKEGLGADENAERFIYTGGGLDRRGYEECKNNVGCDQVPRLLRDLAQEQIIDLTDESFQGVVAEAWALGEPWLSGVDRATWLSLFQLNGFTDKGSRTDPPTETVAVFRGTTEEYKQGMSWTTDIDVARRFAYDRISGRPVGNVYSARIEARWLLAYINEGHSEKEWVVNPTHLNEGAVSRHETIEGDTRQPGPRSQ